MTFEPLLIGFVAGAIFAALAVGGAVALAAWREQRATAAEKKLPDSAT
jgi:hypothetical protein